MVNSVNWFVKTKKGYGIESKLIYKDLYPYITQKISQGLSSNHIVSWIKQEAKNAFKSRFKKEPKDGSLNNCIGRWNEYLATLYLSEIAQEIYQKDGRLVAIFSIPNTSIDRNKVSSKFLSLFDLSEFSPGGSLHAIGDIQRGIIFPSPDFIVVLLNENSYLINEVQNLIQQQAQDPGKLGVYRLLRGKLKANEIKAVLSLKTSNRPDRRYQPSFEAAMIKAVKEAANLHWKYFMVASELTPADQNLFEFAISPSSIVSGEKTRLIDGVCIYQAKKDLFNLIKDALQ